MRNLAFVFSFQGYHTLLLQILISFTFLFLQNIYHFNSGLQINSKPLITRSVLIPEKPVGEKLSASNTIFLYVDS